MADHYLPLPGITIEPEGLSIPKARDVAYVLQTGRLPFVSLLECRRVDSPANGEVVGFDVEVELPQRPVNDIHRHERIAVVFSEDELSQPEVLALRETFPLVPHLNLRPNEFPRSLCVFEEGLSELKLHWSGVAFIEYIRQWLARTAVGTLHAEDQPLEPMLSGLVDPIVIPSSLLSNTGAESPEPIVVQRSDAGKGRNVLFAMPKGQNRQDQKEPKFLATVLSGSPQTHGIINRAPANLYDLHEFLASAQIDLLMELRNRLKLWQTNGRLKEMLKLFLVLIVHLPKTRANLGAPESLDTWAFMTSTPLMQIGIDIGVWAVSNGQPGLLLSVDEDKKGERVPIAPLRTVPSFSRELAVTLNGLKSQYTGRIVLVGVGALGSQAFLNLVRKGYGQWVLVDEDYLLPHNLARYALFGNAVGFPKASSVADAADWTLDSDPIARGIIADVLNSGSCEEEVRQSLQDAQVIIDASTSIAVARHLALDVSSLARRVSMFLNPSGTDLVVLVEDTKRGTPLDLLEMQYYRHLTSNPEFRNHFKTTEKGVRYSGSCRDLSAVIPQDLVALHSAIASHALREAIQEETAKILIWQAEPDRFGVKDSQLSTWELIEYQVGGWTIRTDRCFLDKVSGLRLERLPNETGGVLVGAFDMQRKIVYVIDTIPSPKDSTEWPTVYIRGHFALRQQLAVLRTRSAQMLEYVGEWHSHTVGRSSSPSGDDLKAIRWLANEMNLEGRPGLMLIAVDQGEAGWNVETL